MQWCSGMFRSLSSEAQLTGLELLIEGAMIVHCTMPKGYSASFEVRPYRAAERRAIAHSRAGAKFEELGVDARSWKP